MRKLIQAATPVVFGAAIAVWGVAVGAKAAVDSVVNWWPYLWLWPLAGLTVAFIAAGLIVSLAPPRAQAEPEREQLYSRVLNLPEGTTTNDPRLYERREYPGDVGVPEWEIPPASPAVDGKLIAYRERDKPHRVVTISRWPDADRDFTPVEVRYRRHPRRPR